MMMMMMMMVVVMMVMVKAFKRHTKIFQNFLFCSFFLQNIFLVFCICFFAPQGTIPWRASSISGLTAAVDNQTLALERGGPWRRKIALSRALGKFPAMFLAKILSKICPKFFQNFSKIISKIFPKLFPKFFQNYFQVLPKFLPKFLPIFFQQLNLRTNIFLAKILATLGCNTLQ